MAILVVKLALTSAFACALGAHAQLVFFDEPDLQTRGGSGWSANRWHAKET